MLNCFRNYQIFVNIQLYYLIDSIYGTLILLVLLVISFEIIWFWNTTSIQLDGTLGTLIWTLSRVLV